MFVRRCQQQQQQQQIADQGEWTCDEDFKNGRTDSGSSRPNRGLANLQQLSSRRKSFSRSPPRATALRREQRTDRAFRSDAGGNIHEARLVSCLDPVAQLLTPDVDKAAADHDR
ncbi:unnamed protein product [Lampetra fluviatilis]